MECVLPLLRDRDIDQLLIPFVPRHARHVLQPEEEEEGEEEENGTGLIPYFPFGAIFLWRIMLRPGTAPRMRESHLSLSEAAFKFIFGESLDMVRYTYNQPGIMPASELRQIRPGNKSKRTATHIPQAGGDPVLFSFSQHGYSLPPPVVDGGSDMDEEEDNPNPTGIDEHITQIFNQFIQDIFEKAPNTKGASKPSYCILTRAARLAAKEELLQHKRLSEIWGAYQYKTASKQDLEYAFNHMFPPMNHVTGKTQGYRQCTYYLQWKEFCSTATAMTVNSVRQEIKKRVMKLAWIPHASQDKLWPTSYKSTFTRVPPGPPNPAPRILIRGVPEI